MRQCINPVCHRPISKCDGAVIARDMLEYQDGLRPIAHVRELCARCVLFFDIQFDLDRFDLFEEMLRKNPIPRSLPA